MVREVHHTLQEPLVFRTACVQSRIHIVVKVIQLHDVPAVLIVAHSSAQHAVVHTQFQKHPVGQQGNAMAGGSFVHHSTISRIGERLVTCRRCQISHIFAKVIVDSTDLLVVALVVDT